VFCRAALASDDAVLAMVRFWFKPLSNNGGISRPDSGLGVQVNVRKTIELFLLCSRVVGVCALLEDLHVSLPYTPKPQNPKHPPLSKKRVQP